MNANSTRSPLVALAAVIATALSVGGRRAANDCTASAAAIAEGGDFLCGPEG